MARLSKIIASGLLPICYFTVKWSCTVPSQEMVFTLNLDSDDVYKILFLPNYRF